EIALATKGKYEAYTVLVGNTPKKEEQYNGRFFTRHPDEMVEEDEDNDLFMNIRALMFFRGRDWILSGGEVVDTDVDNSFFKNELGVIKYKRSLQGNKIQLMSKIEMLKLGIPSPNIADAFALTFLRDLDDQTFQTAEERAAILAEDETIDDPHAVF
ncbi:hypothetical protein KGQ31_03245, partial [Patescibacteria group bacterium]|nr:hypothetical protein [Patescibacteria group bacterium]